MLLFRADTSGNDSSERTSACWSCDNAQRRRCSRLPTSGRLPQPLRLSPFIMTPPAVAPWPVLEPAPFHPGLANEGTDITKRTVGLTTFLCGCRASELPLLAMNGHPAARNRLPLYPRKPTFGRRGSPPSGVPNTSVLRIREMHLAWPQPAFLSPALMALVPCGECTLRSAGKRTVAVVPTPTSLCRSR